MNVTKMNSQQTKECQRDKWRFIYQDLDHPDLPQYPKGYYLNLDSGETVSFEDGIANKIGKDDELHVYNMWWFEQ